MSSENSSQSVERNMECRSAIVNVSLVSDFGCFCLGNVSLIVSGEKTLSAFFAASSVNWTLLGFMWEFVVDWWDEGLVNASVVGSVMVGGSAASWLYHALRGITYVGLIGGFSFRVLGIVILVR